MNTDLEYALSQGPSTMKDLMRMTSLSKSSIYKAIKEDDRVQKKASANGPGNCYWMEISVEVAPGEPEQDDRPPSTGEVDIAPPAQSSTRIEPSPRIGRSPTHAGKKLLPNVDSNPRRKGTHGHKSMQIILDNPGITTEDFVLAGGRLVDLRWDVERRNVIAKD